MNGVIDTIGGYEIHPACGMLPMMPQAALEEMAADIKAHGQEQPVYLYDGKILDGRNRLKACQIAGVEPDVRPWTGDDPVRWVLSLNFHRRHLSDDQKAVVGARAETLLTERAVAVEAAEDAAIDGAAGAEVTAAPPQAKALPVAEARTRAIERRARQTAAALINVSTQRIARGRKLLDRAVPELVSAVEQGSVSMSQAQRVATLEPEAQTALVAEGEGAIIHEAKRLQQATASRRPSLQRALNELDEACLEWSLGRGRDGDYRLTGQTASGPISAQAADMKATILEAWGALEAEG